jgi:hypothetical protein
MILVFASLGAMLLSPSGELWKLWTVAAFSLLHGGALAYLLTEDSVREAADHYAQQLLTACEILSQK